MDPDYFSYSCHGGGDSFQNLSRSDYAKVIFCDLYYNNDNTVGCRFQITDLVHEDPADYIGLFRVGYEDLSQCLAFKLLSQTDCEDDGKMLRCTFKPSDLPELENGFYQFLYVTRDNEVCGASMPFQTKSSLPKDPPSDEDIVAEHSEDDFLVVRSNMAEKNRRLQALLDEMTEKCLKHEGEMRKVQQKLKIFSEEKIKLEHLLKKACEEKISLFNESQRIAEEKNILCNEKEEAIRILKEKNKVFSSMFDNYSDKLKEFTDLKDALEADKGAAIADNMRLHDVVAKLQKELRYDKRMLEQEREKTKNLATNLHKEQNALTSQLEDAKLMIEALEKSKQLSMDDLATLNGKVLQLQEKLKDVKCENLVLKTRLSEATLAHEKDEEEKQSMMSELAALKLHIVEVHGSKSRRESSASQDSRGGVASTSAEPPKGNKSSQCHEESIQTDQSNEEELLSLKSHCDELHSQLEEKNTTISKLKEDLVKSNGVVEYLSKERDSAHRNETLKQQALDECILRLNEASELYKKQFRKIEKLKKKLSKGTDFMEKASCASVSTKDTSSIADITEDAESNSVQTPQNHNSDSDTGEHVVRHPMQDNSHILIAVKELAQKRASMLMEAAKDKPSTSKLREVPELQTLIEMNLEKFQNSKSKEEEEEVLYTIPCPVCDQDIGVYMSSTDEMVKHLEMQHKQQICPLCGRLFDMNLPPKYFQFHVEDHFVKGNKK